MILLSFDIEEFDFPLELGSEIEFKTQINVSAEGVKKILNLLSKHNIKATFYSTVVFAQNSSELIKEIVNSGHELASHGYHHSKFETGDYLLSREELEKIGDTTIYGYRTARMMAIDSFEQAKAGYKYDSSLNPTFIPGRYNNLKSKRTIHFDGNLIELPASVTPFRFPLFWLSFHTLPLFIYNSFVGITHKKDGYINIYFHPWEFSNQLTNKDFKVPQYILKCSGDKLLDKLERFIYFCKSKGYDFSTSNSFINSYLLQNSTNK